MKKEIHKAQVMVQEWLITWAPRYYALQVTMK